VSEDGQVLDMSRFMELIYDPCHPYEVGLYDPNGLGTIVIAREVVAAALRHGFAGQGDVQLHLTYQHEPVLILRRAHGAPLALKPGSAEAFLGRCYELVAPGSESDHLDLDALISELLPRTA
jgi:hypothetical protein